MYKISDFDFEIKSVDEDGTFSGYASVFGVVDSQNDIVAKGAFAASLSRRTRPVPILWQHQQANPVGIYPKLAEDERGLFVKGKLLVDEVAKAREAYALVKSGAVSGLSIGYRVKQSSLDNISRIRTIKELELEEISLVTMPSNGEARIDAIKTKLAYGGLTTIRELETVLRDAGFSRSQAVAIAEHGFKGLRDEDEAITGDLSALIAEASSFSLPKF